MSGFAAAGRGTRTRSGSRSSTTPRARTRTRGPSRPRSSGASSATTCSETAGTTSATTSSSTSTARSSRAGTEESTGTSSARMPRVSTRARRGRADRDVRRQCAFGRGAQRAGPPLAWRLDVAHVDPLSSFSWRSTGNPRYPAGRSLTLRTISGHRDTGYTTCPGSRLYGELPALARTVSADRAAEALLPALRPAHPAGFVHFTATLTEALPWSVVVSEPSGNVVATGEGIGTDVDWTWDARTVPAGRYLYAIDAGPFVRPATGAVTGSVHAGRADRARATRGHHSQRRRPPRVDGGQLSPARGVARDGDASSTR